jgi:hypothetical protein
VPDGGGTALTMTIRYADAETSEADFPNIASSASAGFRRLAAAITGAAGPGAPPA